MAMTEICPRLFIGDERDCFTDRANWFVVHACKTPCHQKAVGYRGTLSKTHPNYLILENDNNIYLNMIDPTEPFFNTTLFTKALKFMRKHWNEGKNILVHCNRGESRAPTIAMLFMAKELKLISNESYNGAKADFVKKYPKYAPGMGIQTYLREHWMEVV